MRLNIKILVCLLWLSGFAYANTTNALRDSAEVYYNQAQYDAAINCYEQILQSNMASADLYYNLGNAYYKQGDLALAIVNYERALKLNPSDEATLFNLKMAQSQTIDKIEALPEFLLTRWYKSFVNSFSSNTWAYLSISFFLLALVFLLAFFFARNIQLKKISFFTVLVSFVLSMMFVFTAWQSKKEQYDKVYAIVRTSPVNVKSSPDNKSTNLFILHTGTKLQVLDQVEDWYEIKIANGNVGWVQEADFIRI